MPLPPDPPRSRVVQEGWHAHAPRGHGGAGAGVGKPDQTRQAGARPDSVLRPSSTRRYTARSQQEMARRSRLRAVATGRAKTWPAKAGSSQMRRAEFPLRQIDAILESSERAIAQTRHGVTWGDGIHTHQLTPPVHPRVASCSYRLVAPIGTTGSYTQSQDLASIHPK